jgi:hypothetical protein
LPPRCHHARCRADYAAADFLTLDATPRHFRHAADASFRCRLMPPPPLISPIFAILPRISCVYAACFICRCRRLFSHYFFHIAMYCGYLMMPPRRLPRHSSAGYAAFISRHYAIAMLTALPYAQPSRLFFAARYHIDAPATMALSAFRHADISPLPPLPPSYITFRRRAIAATYFADDAAS